MSKENSLRRFFDVQERDYQVAYEEIANGKKRSHWMWYIFPQIKGLGFSEAAKFYGIQDLEEAKSFLAHPILGSRLVRICEKLVELDTCNANTVFGSPDDLKLRSSMTLFIMIPGSDDIFKRVLEKFFHGMADPQTLELLTLLKDRLPIVSGFDYGKVS